MKRRIFAALFAVCILGGTLLSCGEKKEEAPSAPPQVEILLAAEKTDGVWSAVSQASGVKIALTPAPADRMAETLLLKKSAPGQWPDLVYLKRRADMEALVSTGAVVDLRDSLDRLTSYQKALFLQEDGDERQRQHIASDGGLYVLPALGLSCVESAQTWLYRADVFARARLSPPETMRELAAFSVALKHAYPMSTPVLWRGGQEGLSALAPAWQKGAALGAYYDFDEEKWRYGASEEWAGNFVSFWSAMMKSGLLPKNILTMTDAETDTLIAQNRVFLMPGTPSQIESMQKKYPYQDWQMMPAPRADVASGQHKLVRRVLPFAGYAICKTEDERRLSDALTFLDWMYSDEAETLLSAQAEKEGAAFSRRDGLSTRLTDRAASKPFPAIRTERAALAAFYEEERTNPAAYVAFNADEEEKIWREQNKLALVTDTAISDFLTGKRPMTEWQAFSESLDTKKLLGVYRDAFKRTEP